VESCNCSCWILAINRNGVHIFVHWRRISLHWRCDHGSNHNDCWMSGVYDWIYRRIYSHGGRLPHLRML
jgi:hypothetical protein